MRESLVSGLPVHERRSNVAGVDTAFLEGGEGPPIVLLHGVGSFGPEWGLIIPGLVRRHRVVVPDLPGLGESVAGPGKRGSDAAVEWLSELIAQTCEEPPLVVGHSLGGALAAHLAIASNERVRGIVLVNSSSLGRFRPAPGVILALMRLSARPTPESRDRFLRQVMVDPARARNAWGDRWDALEAYDLDQAARPSVDKATQELLRRIGVRRIRSDQLRQIDIPVSLIWGRSDRLMRVRIAERASAEFGWPLHPIDDCGHGPHLERHEEFLRALDECL